MKTATRLSLVVAVVFVVLTHCLLTTSVEAALVVNLDANQGAFGNETRNYSGLAIAPDLLTNTSWNIAQIPAGVGTTTVSNLTASDGFTVTTISVAVSHHGSDAGFGGNALMSDGATTGYGNYGRRSITVTGLDSLLTYDFYLYGSNNTHFLLGGITQQAVTSGSFRLAQYSDITPSLAGSVTIHYGDAGVGSGNQSANGNGFAGMQIVASVIPEPASLALLGLGGVLIATQRQRA